MKRRKKREPKDPRTKANKTFSTLKTDLAGQLERSRTTLDKWILLAIQANRDFAKAYLYQFEKHGERAPLNPYQVWVLRAISNYQRRTRDPKKLRTDTEILEFIRNQNFSLSDFLATIPIYEEETA